MRRAVLDACVLVPSMLTDLLLRCAEHDLYAPYWTDEILGEVARNLPDSVSEAAVLHRISMMKAAFPEAMVTGYEPAVALMTNHQKDRHVLAAAVACEADVVVTANLRDFRVQALAPYGIAAVHPDEFLCRLNEAAPELVVSIILQQAKATGQGGRPKLSVSDVLTSLRGSRIADHAIH